jgi:hypothetical protein
LKVLKGQSKTVNGHTENKMVKRKRTNNDLQNILQKTKDRATRTPIQIRGALMCSGRVGSSCFICDTRRVTLFTNTMIRHERGKDREVFTTSGSYPWSFVIYIFRNGKPSDDGNGITFEVINST